MDLKMVARQLHDVPYMDVSQARLLAKIWESCPAGDILELGFAHGKGSAFLGVLAKSRNATAVCVDNISALDRQPRADEVVAQVGLQDHVELVFADDGYLWWMKQQLELGSARRFSMIYLDGAHDWFVDGFAALLLERFVETGGVVIFDDLDWTFTSSPRRTSSRG